MHSFHDLFPAHSHAESLPKCIFPGGLEPDPLLEAEWSDAKAAAVMMLAR